MSASRYLRDGLSRSNKVVVLTLASSLALAMGCSGDEGSGIDVGMGGATHSTGSPKGQGGAFASGEPSNTRAAGASGRTIANGGAAAGLNTAGGGSKLASGAVNGGATGTGGPMVAGGKPSSGGPAAVGGRASTEGSSATSGKLSAAGPGGNGGKPSTGTPGATGGKPSTGTPSATGGQPGTGTPSATGGKSNTGEPAATGGTTSAGSAGNCTAPPAASALIGWATVSGATTGGGTATPITVTTLAALQNAAKGTNAAVIYVKGNLAAGNISVGSNKTIAGICGATVRGHLELNGSANVIIRNIKIVGYGEGNCSKDPDYDSGTGCSSGSDAISVQNNANHIWFDHCDISDGTDGNLDITKGSDYITVSWTKFHYTPRADNQGDDSTGASGHRFSNLVGGSDSESSTDKLNITWHHNWWAENVMERMPRVRFGKNHLFNNVWSASGNNYCVRAGYNAHILIENSVFVGVKSPQAFNNTSDETTANITASPSKNTYTNTSGTTATGGGGTPFTAPPYSYTMDALSSVQSVVQDPGTGAGPH